MQYTTSTTISATPEAIWDILVDISNWTEWNTTIQEIEGNAAPGGKIKLRAKVNPGRTFSINVAEFSPPGRMVWSGGMPLGLFKGERTYTLTAQDAGTEFTMTEVYSGLMAGMITRSIPDLQPSFDEFAAALKTKAEAAGKSRPIGKKRETL